MLRPAQCIQLWLHSGTTVELPVSHHLDRNSMWRHAAHRRVAMSWDRLANLQWTALLSHSDPQSASGRIRLVAVSLLNFDSGIAAHSSLQVLPPRKHVCCQNCQNALHMMTASRASICGLSLVLDSSVALLLTCKPLLLTYVATHL